MAWHPSVACRTARHPRQLGHAGRNCRVDSSTYLGWVKLRRRSLMGTSRLFLLALVIVRARPFALFTSPAFSCDDLARPQNLLTKFRHDSLLGSDHTSSFGTEVDWRRPSGKIPPDYSLRPARALERRDLVRISGRGPSWAAFLTDQGRRALNNPASTLSSPGSPTDTAAPNMLAAATAGRTKQTSTRLPGRAPTAASSRRSKSEDLLAALLANGTVNFELKQYQSVQSQVGYLIRKGLVPKEKIIEVRRLGWGSDPVKVTLGDRPDWQYKQLDAIDIPTSLRNSLTGRTYTAATRRQT